MTEPMEDDEWLLPTEPCPVTGHRYIRAFPDALTAAECETIRAKFDADPKRDAGRIGINDGYVSPAIKTSTDLRTDGREEWQQEIAWFNRAWTKSLGRYMSCVPQFARLAISGNTFIPTGMLLQRYEKDGGRFNWHADSWNPDSSLRVLAFILYLNDVAEGGETDFSEFREVRIKPRAGTALWFPPTWEYTHRGCVPRSGPKYIATTFVMYMPPGMKK